MDWISFFIGAVVMLFVLVIVILLIPLKDRKESEKWHHIHRADMLDLHRYWEIANGLAEERNEILRNGFKLKE